MIKFLYHPTPNSAKVLLFLEEADLSFEVVPIDLSKDEQNIRQSRDVNPSGMVPAIIDLDAKSGRPVRVFDSTAILLYLSEKTGRFGGTDEQRPEVLSWLIFIGTELGPFSRQSVHVNFAAGSESAYASNRYRREADSHYRVLDQNLAQRPFIAGSDYTIADMSGWGWVDRASRILGRADAPLNDYPHVRRWFKSVDSRPAAVRARQVCKDPALNRPVAAHTA